MMTDRQSEDAKPLRIAIVASVDTTIHALLAAQVRALEEAGYDVRCLCSPGSSREVLIDEGFTMVDVPIQRRISPLVDLRALWRMFAYFRRESISIVHTHTPKASLLGQLAAWLAGVPVIVNTVHGFYFHDHMSPMRRRFYVLMERIAARFTSMMLCQNPEDVETAVQRHIVPRARVRLLGNGVPLERFDPSRFDETKQNGKRAELAIPSDAVVVTIIARLVREKGILELLEAMRGIMQRHPHVHLMMIGPAEPQKADAIGLDVMASGDDDPRVHWLGHRDDIAELLSCTDVFALPSWREGFPRSAIEAAAMVIPIVATDIRGCRQVVTDGVNGFLVPLRDTVALERAIERLVDDPEFRSRLGLAGREKALREFCERRVCEIVVDTIREQIAQAQLNDPAVTDRGDAEQAV